MRMTLSLPSVEHRSVASQRRRLIWFVLGSLLLHVLLVALWRGEPPAGPVGQSTFQVTLVARHGDTPQQPAAGQRQPGRANEAGQPDDMLVASGEPSRATENNKPPFPPVTPQPTVRIPDRTQHAQRHPPEHVRSAVNEIPHAVKAGATSDLAALEPGHMSAASGSTSDGADELTSAARYHRVRDELLQALLPHFDYPPLARRRGWQGRVRIGLLVKADGDLSGVHLIESSGYALLDKAAIKNVSQLRNVPAAGRWLNGRNLDVILPVTYRLE
jgi:protein TonB